MERNSLIYKMRRATQVIVNSIIPNEVMSKIYFQIVLKKNLNLNNPKTFNEKLQWLKLYYYPQNNTIVQCSDKFAVRSYLETRGFKEILVPLLGYWNNSSDINWDILPDKFVLKCNHGCAYNIVCEDKSLFDVSAAKKQINVWMKEDFGKFNIEIHYSMIKKHMIICEEYLGEDLVDYKFFCFNGEPKFLYVSKNLIHDRQAEMGFFYLDGTRMPLKRDDYASIKQVVLPGCFKEMIEISKKLSSDFPFVRVDFFLADGKYYFAEFTFTPSACMMPFDPDEYDLEFGEFLDISYLIRASQII